MAPYNDGGQAADDKTAKALGAKTKPGRPEEMTGGKRHNIYLDAASWAIAVKVGKGNASAGIRDALAELKR